MSSGKGHIPAVFTVHFLYLQISKMSPTILSFKHRLVKCQFGFTKMDS